MKSTLHTDATTGGRAAPRPCNYLNAVLRLAALGLVPAGSSLLTIQHDPWCPVLGGDGSKRCAPTFTLNGVPVTTEGETVT